MIDIKPAKIDFGTETFFIAFLSVAAAFVATLMLSSFFAPVVSPLFLIAVMISAWRGGLAAGFLATVLSSCANIFFLMPDLSEGVGREEISHVLLDVLASLIIGTLSAGRRRAQLEREQILQSEQKARIEAESANAGKDDFLAAVSHELRTPLTTIKTLTHYLRHKNATEEERSEYLADIAAECDRQIDLVHNLLDLTRIGAGGFRVEAEKTDIGKVLRECVKIEHISAAAALHKISLVVEDDLPPAKADADALRRAVCTMVENSVKYTPPGGTIRLEAQRTGARHIEICVADNGRGIHARDLPHIFERFYRGHSAGKDRVVAGDDAREVTGIGLGLYLAKTLVEGMNGKIGVESEIGKGSKFKIRLEVWRETAKD